MLVDALDDALSLAQTARIEQHRACPAVNVVLLHEAPHAAHAHTLLVRRHAQCAVERFRALIDVIRVDGQRVVQLARRAGELRQHEHALLVVARRDELLRDEVHSVVQARDDAHVGRFVFIQIAAPTRSSLDEYQGFEEDVHALATRINARFADAAFAPIRLKAEHHEPEVINEYYRASDVCVVTSLHDGMNLVAKEFVASRDDEQGVLVLSQFAGASRELAEALVVNPYDADQCGAALHQALTMKPEEQRDRMRFMRAVVREFNVYRWAGRMLLDAAVMRQRGRFRVPA